MKAHVVVVEVVLMLLPILTVLMWSDGEQRNI